MSKTEFESLFVGSTPLFPRLQDCAKRPPRESGVIERFFAALADELAKEGSDLC